MLVIYCYATACVYGDEEDALFEAVKHGSSLDRKAAIQKLDHPTQQPRVLQERLFQILSDRSLPSEVRIDCMEYYLKLADASIRHQSILIEMAKSSSETMELRLLAMTGLRVVAVDASSKEAAHSMMSILEDDTQSPEVRIHSGFLLCGLPTPPNGLFQLTLEILLDRSESTDLRLGLLQAGSVLGGHEKHSPIEMASVMLQIGSDSQESVPIRNQALDSLIDTILAYNRKKILKSKIEPTEEYLRFAAVCSESMLRIILNSNENERVREEASWVLRSLTPLDPNLVDEVTKLLSNDNAVILGNVVHVLGEMKDSATGAVPALIKLWKDESLPEETRTAIRQALEKIDSESSSNLLVP